MSTTQSIQSYLPQTVEHPITANVAFIPTINYQAPLSFSVGNIVGTSAQIEEMLITVGEYYAIRLRRVLDVLKSLNEDAIYPIMSVFEPYMDLSSELDLRMPPLSTKRVTINVTDRGRAKPNLYIE